MKKDGMNGEQIDGEQQANKRLRSHYLLPCLGLHDSSWCPGYAPKQGSEPVRLLSAVTLQLVRPLHLPCTAATKDAFVATPHCRSLGVYTWLLGQVAVVARPQNAPEITITSLAMQAIVNVASEHTAVPKRGSRECRCMGKRAHGVMGIYSASGSCEGGGSCRQGARGGPML